MVRNADAAVMAGQWSSFGRLTWHANAMEDPDLVQAGGIVLAWIRGTLIHIDFTTWARVTLLTLALEGALCIEAFASMLTRVGS